VRKKASSFKKGMNGESGKNELCARRGAELFARNGCKCVSSKINSPAFDLQHLSYDENSLLTHENST